MDALMLVSLGVPLSSELAAKPSTAVTTVVSTVVTNSTVHVGSGDGDYDSSSAPNIVQAAASCNLAVNCWRTQCQWRTICQNRNNGVSGNGGSGLPVWASILIIVMLVGLLFSSVYMTSKQCRDSVQKCFSSSGEAAPLKPESTTAGKPSSNTAGIFG